MNKLAAFVLLLASAPSFAYAHAGNDDPNVIHACVGNLSKVARIVGVRGACLSAPATLAETAMHWHIAGPSGPAGQPGAQGDQGLQGVPGPQGPIGPVGPSAIAGTLSFNCFATDIPVNFTELHMLPDCSMTIDVVEGQKLLTQAEIELQPAGSDPASMFLAHLTIGHRPVGMFDPPSTLDVGPPLGFPGVHNRLHTIGGLISDLPAGSYEIGVAGLGYPGPGDPLPMLHRVRVLVLVLNP